MGPIFFCMFACTLHPMVLPKMMYMSPMSKETRRKFLEVSCVVRIAFPIIVGGLGELVLLAFGICNWLSGVGIFINIAAFSIMLGLGINAGGYGKKMENGQRVMELSTSMGIMEGVIIVSTLVLGLGYAVEAGGDAMANLWVKCILLGAQLLIQIPIVWKYSKNWKPAVERALCYESSYKILEKK